jgi:YD repeat-containing protein
LIQSDDWGVVDSVYFNGRFLLHKYFQVYGKVEYGDKNLISQIRLGYWNTAGWVEVNRIVYGYDKSNRVVSKIFSDSSKIYNYAYDALGNLVSCHYSMPYASISDWTIMEYDALGRLKDKNYNHDGAPYLTLSHYDYDSLGYTNCTILASYIQIAKIDTIQYHQIKYDISGNVILDAYGMVRDISKDTSIPYGYGKVECVYNASGKIVSRHCSMYVGSSQWSDYGQSDFSYDLIGNLTRCSILSEFNNNLAPTTIILYDHYGNIVSRPLDFVGYAYTYFFYSNHSTTGVSRSQSNIDDFALGQNYPNPFNPTTSIRFKIPERSRVRLTVYDLLGRQIAMLANEEMAAGYFERAWNANVLSGIYFCRLEAVSATNGKYFTDVKKMILLK